MALTFSKHEDVVFSRAPLLSVLCQIRFKPVLSLLSDVGVSGFQEALRFRYPILEREQNTNVAVSPQQSGPQVGIQQHAPVWRLTGGETNKYRVSIGTDFVSLDTSQYQDFGEFERLMFVLNALDRTIHPGEATRDWS